MKYVKRSEIIEAFHYDGDLKDSDGNYYVPDWAVKAYKDGTLYYMTTPEGSPHELFIKVRQEEEVITSIHIPVGHYIVKDDELGLIYAYDSTWFNLNYEEYY